MKFIPPMEISSRIMTLIEDADKHLIIVSPYFNIGKWDKMKRCLQKAKERGVTTIFVARKNVNGQQDFSPLTQLGIKPVLIQDLHAKIYLNEKFAIVASQNMIQYSDTNSIDIGYQTETAAEREELEQFIKKNLAIQVPQQAKTISPLTQAKTNSQPEKARIENVLHDDEVETLYQKFLKKFPGYKFVRTATYVFGGQLIPSADIMMSEQYTIKFKKSLPDCDKILKQIAKISFDSFYKYKIDFQTEHNNFYYVKFIPSNFHKYEDIDELAKDYIDLSKRILEKEIFKANLRTFY
jgi:hypothetical protein